MNKYEQDTINQRDDLLDEAYHLRQANEYRQRVDESRNRSSLSATGLRQKIHQQEYELLVRVVEPHICLAQDEYFESRIK
jgi:hypothetical protein